MKPLEKALILAIETLADYANPESYHAIAFIADRPAGWFIDDVSKVDRPDYRRKMHGAAARKALKKIEKILNPKTKQ